ncbi:MAG: TldD/PmbA family protein [Dehalococcoidales bacterium]|nr:TldD/PmbA family protein [Dehalococcoidales bacterium]
MEKLLALARKQAEEAEVFVTSSEATPVQFESNRLKHIQNKQSKTVALRIIKNGKIGCATSTNIENREELVANAVATAEFGSRAEFQFPSLQKYPEVEIFDSAVEKVTIEQMNRVGTEIIARITGHSPEVTCEGGVTKATYTCSIINSRGGQASYRQSAFGISVEGSLIRGTDMLFVGDSDTSCHPLLEADKIAKTVIRQLEMAKRQASAATKPMPVIFTPDGIASSLIIPMISAFNGKTVLEGASSIGDKLGKQVFDNKLNLRDDPTIPYCPASQPCDDEAVPCHLTPLITNGTVDNFLYDLQTAARAKTKSTGNGHRQGGLPTPSIHALVITPGSVGFDDMVRGIDEGLIVEQLLGAGQGNMLGGDFSGNVLLGFKIEKGEIVGRVKDTMVSGNIYQLLKDISAIGNDVKWVGGSLNTPSILCTNVSVASR